MPDECLFNRVGPFPLSAIAARVVAKPLCTETGAILIEDIDISLFFDARYFETLRLTRAGVIAGNF
jgi:hypothetical protein